MPVAPPPNDEWGFWGAVQAGLGSGLLGPGGVVMHAVLPWIVNDALPAVGSAVGDILGWPDANEDQLNTLAEAWENLASWAVNAQAAANGNADIASDAWRDFAGGSFEGYLRLFATGAGGLGEMSGAATTLAAQVREYAVSVEFTKRQIVWEISINLPIWAATFAAGPAGWAAGAAARIILARNSASFVGKAIGQLAGRAASFTFPRPVPLTPRKYVTDTVEDIVENVVEEQIVTVGPLMEMDQLETDFGKDQLALATVAPVVAEPLSQVADRVTRPMGRLTERVLDRVNINQFVQHQAKAVVTSFGSNAVVSSVSSEMAVDILDGNPSGLLDLNKHVQAVQENGIAAGAMGVLGASGSAAAKDLGQWATKNLISTNGTAYSTFDPGQAVPQGAPVPAGAAAAGAGTGASTAGGAVGSGATSAGVGGSTSAGAAGATAGSAGGAVGGADANATGNSVSGAEAGTKAGASTGAGDQLNAPPGSGAGGAGGDGQTSSDAHPRVNSTAAADAQTGSDGPAKIQPGKAPTGQQAGPEQATSEQPADSEQLTSAQPAEADSQQSVSPDNQISDQAIGGSAATDAPGTGIADAGTIADQTVDQQTAGRADVIDGQSIDAQGNETSAPSGPAGLPSASGGPTATQAGPVHTSATPVAAAPGAGQSASNDLPPSRAGQVVTAGTRSADQSQTRSAPQTAGPQAKDRPGETAPDASPSERPDGVVPEAGPSARAEDGSANDPELATAAPEVKAAHTDQPPGRPGWFDEGSPEIPADQQVPGEAIHESEPKNYEGNVAKWFSDSRGRLRSVHGRLKTAFDGSGRTADDLRAQAASGKGGIEGDEGGHALAWRFFKETVVENLFPQNANLNRGAFKRVENEWASWLNAGYELEVVVRLPPGQTRPDSVTVTYEVIDAQSGRTVFTGGRTFINRSGQITARYRTRAVKAFAPGNENVFEGPEDNTRVAARRAFALDPESEPRQPSRSLEQQPLRKFYRKPGEQPPASPAPDPLPPTLPMPAATVVQAGTTDQPGTTEPDGRAARLANFVADGPVQDHVVVVEQVVRMLQGPEWRGFVDVLELRANGLEVEVVTKAGQTILLRFEVGPVDGGHPAEYRRTGDTEYAVMISERILGEDVSRAVVHEIREIAKLGEVGEFTPHQQGRMGELLYLDHEVRSWNRGHDPARRQLYQVKMKELVEELRLAENPGRRQQLPPDVEAAVRRHETALTTSPRPSMSPAAHSSPGPRPPDPVRRADGQSSTRSFGGNDVTRPVGPLEVGQQVIAQLRAVVPEELPSVAGRSAELAAQQGRPVVDGRILGWSFFGATGLDALGIDLDHQAFAELEQQLAPLVETEGQVRLTITRIPRPTQVAPGYRFTVEVVTKADVILSSHSALDLSELVDSMVGRADPWYTPYQGSGQTGLRRWTERFVPGWVLVSAGSERAMVRKDVQKAAKLGSVDDLGQGIYRITAPDGRSFQLVKRVGPLATGTVAEYFAVPGASPYAEVTLSDQLAQSEIEAVIARVLAGTMAGALSPTPGQLDGTVERKVLSPAGDPRLDPGLKMQDREDLAELRLSVDQFDQAGADTLDRARDRRTGTDAAHRRAAARRAIADLITSMGLGAGQPNAEILRSLLDAEDQQLVDRFQERQDLSDDRVSRGSYLAKAARSSGWSALVIGAAAYLETGSIIIGVALAVPTIVNSLFGSQWERWLDARKEVGKKPAYDADRHQRERDYPGTEGMLDGRRDPVEQSGKLPRATSPMHYVIRHAAPAAAATGVAFALTMAGIPAMSTALVIGVSAAAKAFAERIVDMQKFDFRLGRVHSSVSQQLADTKSVQNLLLAALQDYQQRLSRLQSLPLPGGETTLDAQGDDQSQEIKSPGMVPFGWHALAQLIDNVAAAARRVVTVKPELVDNDPTALAKLVSAWQEGIINAIGPAVPGILFGAVGDKIFMNIEETASDKQKTWDHRQREARRGEALLDALREPLLGLHQAVQDLEQLLGQVHPGAPLPDLTGRQVDRGVLPPPPESPAGLRPRGQSSIVVYGLPIFAAAASSALGVYVLERVFDLPDLSVVLTLAGAAAGLTGTPFARYLFRRAELNRKDFLADALGKQEVDRSQLVQQSAIGKYLIRQLHAQIVQIREQSSPASQPAQVSSQDANYTDRIRAAIERAQLDNLPPTDPESPDDFDVREQRVAQLAHVDRMAADLDWQNSVDPEGAGAAVTRSWLADAIASYEAMVSPGDGSTKSFPDLRAVSPAAGQRVTGGATDQVRAGVEQAIGRLAAEPAGKPILKHRLTALEEIDRAAKAVDQHAGYASTGRGTEESYKIVQQELADRIADYEKLLPEAGVPGGLPRPALSPPATAPPAGAPASVPPGGDDRSPIVRALNPRPPSP